MRIFPISYIIFYLIGMIIFPYGKCYAQDETEAFSPTYLSSGDASGIYFEYHSRSYKQSYIPMHEAPKENSIKSLFSGKSYKNSYNNPGGKAFGDNTATGSLNKRSSGTDFNPWLSSSIFSLKKENITPLAEDILVDENGWPIEGPGGTVEGNGTFVGMPLGSIYLPFSLITILYISIIILRSGRKQTK